jgi:hypothetical protein
MLRLRDAILHACKLLHAWGKKGLASFINEHQHLEDHLIRLHS